MTQKLKILHQYVGNDNTTYSRVMDQYDLVNSNEDHLKLNKDYFYQKVFSNMINLNTLL